MQTNSSRIWTEKISPFYYHLLGFCSSRSESFSIIHGLLHSVAAAGCFVVQQLVHRLQHADRNLDEGKEIFGVNSDGKEKHASVSASLTLKMSLKNACLYAPTSTVYEPPPPAAELDDDSVSAAAAADADAPASVSTRVAICEWTKFDADI